MKVSILIPVSGRTLYLTDCLESLKEQAYADAEVIIIDDNADGQLQEVIDCYKDSLAIRVVRPAGGRTGVAAARNAGLDAALGEYVYFLDSDDYIYENAIEKLVLAADDQEADIAYGKKKSTWYKRDFFVATYQQEQVESGEDEEDTAEGAQLYAEEGGDSEASSVDDNVLLESEEDENPEEEISEEELLRRKDARKRKAYRFMVSSKKGLTNVSVLNILFRRSLIEENGIRFAEQFKYFSDLGFLIQALSKAETYARVMGAKYVKRKHNDPINFPALSQVKDPNRFEEYVAAYEHARALVPEGCDLKERLDKQVISYYARIFAPRIRRAKGDSWREERFQEMRRLANQMDRETIHKLKGYKKRLIKALMKGDVKKSLTIVNRHLGWKKFKKITRNKRALAKFLYIHSFLKKPMKENWVICESFFGSYYSDSPKAIYEYISRNYPGKFRFIWVYKEKKHKNIPYPHSQVKRYSIRYAYYLARCKYNLYNCRQPMFVRKRKGNIFLETWHGTPLKRLVFDQEEVCGASPLYKQQFHHQAGAWDYLVSPNHFSTEIFRSCFMYRKAILETGYPRNDILHAPGREEREAAFRKKLGIPADKKTILYAPTWRDDEYYGRGEYKFALKLDLQKMKEALGDEYVVLLRTHYFIADAVDVSEMGDFVMNFCRYDDISELYLVSDILITDYSSVFFDYAGLRRPMIFYTYDLDKYRDILRGFYMSIEDEVPGPLAFTTEEVIDAIQNIDQVTETYKEKYDIFYKKFCSLEDGRASEKVAKVAFGLDGAEEFASVINTVEKE